MSACRLVAILCAFFLLSASAYASVAVTSSNFPDSIFRKYVSENFDSDSDGVLSDSEIASVKAVDVHGMGISRLNGIENFTALEDLKFTNNNVANIDLSKNTALVSLDCRDNPSLIRLDVSNCPSLRRLRLASNNTALTTLNISNTAIRSLSDLYYLYELRKFFARNCSNLASVSISSYVLDTLDVSGCTALQTLYCDDNYLNTLDLSDCTALQRLSCQNNHLAVLDLSNNTAITSITCSPQKLTDKPIAFDSGEYPFKFAFSSIMPESLISRVVQDSVHGYTSEGAIIDSQFSNGIAEFASLPAEIDYDFTTGWGDLIMSVNVPISTSGGNSSQTAPVIISSALPNAVVGISYLAEFYATGVHPITWTLTSGTLPDGLEFSSSGTIQGTPSATGTYTFTLQAQNAAGTASASYTLRITESQIFSMPSITTSTLQDGTAEVGYGAAVKASGARPMIWALIAGNLPDGLEFDDEGGITGTPSEAGTYTFTVQAQNAAGIDSKELTLRIAEAFPKTKPMILTDTLEPATIGSNYICQLTASGTPPITWSLAKKSKLPNGMTLSESGLLSGVVPKTGTKKITITASNAYGTESRVFKLDKYELPEITTASLKEAQAGKNYSLSFSKKGTKPFTWQIEGSLPDGMTFDSSKGKISGKPAAPGTYTFRVALSNPAGDYVRFFTMKVNAELPKISTSSLKSGTEGKPYSVKLKAAGTQPINLMLLGYLPEGLAFDAENGTISGTPTEICADRKITITAQNIAGETVKEYRLTIKGVAPKITSTLPNGTLNTYYTAELTAEGTTPITWSAGSLPSGLVLSGGKIIGVPAQAGKFKVKLTAANSVKSVSKTLTLKVEDTASASSMTGREDVYDADYVVVSELGTVSVDEAGMYDFDVVLSEDVEAGAELLYLAGSSEPCGDDKISEFFDSEGAETDVVQEDRKLTLSVWLNPNRTYKPSIAVKR